VGVEVCTKALYAKWCSSTIENQAHNDDYALAAFLLISQIARKSGYHRTKTTQHLELLPFDHRDLEVLFLANDGLLIYLPGTIYACKPHA
jgi:hypothetical protein